MEDLLRDRLDDLIQARRQHVTDSAYYGGAQEHHEYIDEHDNVSFKHQDDYAYYESLRGHINEVRYLLAALAQLNA